MGLLTAKLQALPLAPEDSSVEGEEPEFELTPKETLCLDYWRPPPPMSSSGTPPLLASDDEGNDVVDSIG
jgi:hypothetical protein